MLSQDLYKNKYLKYKNKYFNLKSQVGGGPSPIEIKNYIGGFRKIVSNISNTFSNLDKFFQLKERKETDEKRLFIPPLVSHIKSNFIDRINNLISTLQECNSSLNSINTFLKESNSLDNITLTPISNRTNFRVNEFNEVNTGDYFNTTNLSITETKILLDILLEAFNTNNIQLLIETIDELVEHFASYITTITDEKKQVTNTMQLAVPPSTRPLTLPKKQSNLDNKPTPSEDSSLSLNWGDNPENW
jgi:hypothetical protein